MGQPAAALVEHARVVGRALRGRYREVEPGALREDDDFTRIVRLLAEPDRAHEVLVRLLNDADVFVMQIVFAATAASGRGPGKWERSALRHLGRASQGEIPIILDAPVAASRRPVIAAVLGHVNESRLLVPAVADSVR